MTLADQTFTTLDDEAVSAIASLFGVEAKVEPYSPDGSTVYRLDLDAAADGIVMILWPSLRRVDVRRSGEHSWVLKNIGSIEVVDGIEVAFRPTGLSGHLFVSVNGFVNMVIG